MVAINIHYLARYFLCKDVCVFLNGSGGTCGVQPAISAHWSAWYLEGPLRSSSGEMSHVPRAHSLLVSEPFSVLFVPWWSSIAATIPYPNPDQHLCFSGFPTKMESKSSCYFHDFQISSSINIGTWKIHPKWSKVQVLLMGMDCPNMNGLVMYMST